MAEHLQREDSILPITALAFLKLDLLYLLAGEGEYLKVFHHGTREALYTHKVFESQVIHGIACKKYVEEGKGEQALLLLWGGRSLSVLIIKIIRDMNGDLHINVRQTSSALQMDDWILDGCFQDMDPTNLSHGKTSPECLLVTAHNELHVVRVDEKALPESNLPPVVACIASGPRSILYSAHVVWSPNNCVLIAAGTVFGEVLLWSHELGDIYLNGITTLCYRFDGHEGSVFGVQISEVQSIEGNDKIPQRRLASCSDDRTIRIWDIPNSSTRIEKDVASKVGERKHDVGFPEKTNGTAHSRSSATIMGHASRIWGLRFLAQDDDSRELVSYGEDGTAQVWQLTSKTEMSMPSEAGSPLVLNLEHQKTYSYHSGKNIWAVADCVRPSGEVLIATGGADGQVVTYEPTLHRKVLDSDCCAVQSTMTEVMNAARPKTGSTDLAPTRRVRTIARDLFDGLEGQWNLFRKIENMNSNYPSGTLEGVATFQSRPPSDLASDGEYLYSETGNFVTEGGLVMKASRQYVYRYQEDTDSITVWFVKTEDSSTVDYFFHDLDFRNDGDECRQEVKVDVLEKLTASGHHLCGEDDYNVIYCYSIHYNTLREFTVSFTVVGPKKDYVTTAMYTRPGQYEPPGPISSNMAIPQRVGVSTASIDYVENHSRKRSPSPKPDSFKTYAWLSETQFLISTERGNLLIGTLNRSSEQEECRTAWEMISQEPLLKASCIATSIVSFGICFLTGADGTVFIYDHSYKRIKAIHSLRGKAGFTKAQRLDNWNDASHPDSVQTIISVVAASLGCSIATVLLLWQNENSPVLGVRKQYNVELPTDFIVTSSCILNIGKTLILGSRNGGLAIYNLSECELSISKNTPSTYITDIHGQDAVTAIEMVPTNPLSSDISHIITAGRNGSYAIHQVIYNNHQLPTTIETVHTGAPPFGPNIEGICIQEETLYLWGFRSKDFIVWNETRKIETMTVNCGGAHRNWAYHHHQNGEGGGNFIYTKASTCHLHMQKQSSHQIIQHGSHGREIKAITVSVSLHILGNTRRYLATGAEDTTIRIFDVSGKGFKCLSLITKHTTGLQALRWSTDGRFLFSAAGCEEFFIWRVRSAPLVTVGVVCEARCPRGTDEGDLRIMDFAVLDMRIEPSKNGVEGEDEAGFLITMVYSDSSIRVFRYHKPTKTFNILCSGVYSTSCFTQIAYLHFGAGPWICTAGTDGHLAFWPLPLQIAETHKPENNTNPVNPTNPTSPTTATPKHTLTYTKCIPIHQSSIKSLTTTSLSNGSYIIATAGDDGAIAFIHLTPSPQNHPPAHHTLLIPKAHASAVTAIAYLGTMEAAGAERTIPTSMVRYRFASVGNDQRVKVWIVGLDSGVGGKERMGVVKGGDFGTEVADASCMDVDREGEGRGKGVLFVAGIGMERWSIGDGVGMEGVGSE